MTTPLGLLRKHLEEEKEYNECRERAKRQWPDPQDEDEDRLREKWLQNRCRQYEPALSKLVRRRS